MAIKVQEGKRYVRRDGKVSGVVTKNYGAYSYVHPFKDGNETYDEHGSTSMMGIEYNEDFVAEYTEEKSTPDCGVIVSTSFVKEAHQNACLEWKQRIEKEVPELFEKKFSVGEWVYWSGQDPTIGMIERENKHGVRRSYVLSNTFDCKYPYERHTSCHISHLRKATEKEVETALIKEAKKRFGEDWENAKIERSLTSPYNDCPNTLGFAPMYSRNYLWNRNGCIFKDGKWAEIIKEEPLIELTLNQIAEKWGVQVDKIRIKE